jgi:hypothetical protein
MPRIQLVCSDHRELPLTHHALAGERGALAASLSPRGIVLWRSCITAAHSAQVYSEGSNRESSISAASTAGTPSRIPFSRRCQPCKSHRQTLGPIPSPESNWCDQAARSLFPPIERTSLQLPTKTGHFKAVFQCFSRVRSTESSEFMERARREF